MTTVAVVRGMSKADAEMQTTSRLEARVVAPLLAGIVMRNSPSTLTAWFSGSSKTVSGWVYEGACPSRKGVKNAVATRTSVRFLTVISPPEVLSAGGSVP
jgi:hypothetical protein